MAYNEALANQVREAIQHLPVEEKIMFSGVAFMVNDKMCINVMQNELMLRIDPALQEELVEKPGCREMVMKGKTVKGYVLVEEPVLQSYTDFLYWINLALDYNERARKSNSRKKV
jgi:TfoX/Sxy family transcriptional regulator of competence genes